MIGRLLGAWLLSVVLCAPARAQADLYDPASVREIRIYFAEANWRHLMDSLFLVSDDERLIGDVSIDGTLLEDVGVRWKGYSSYSPDQVKNPFNIKLDEVHDGQDYQGFSKIKLSNVFQDPSFLREVLSYEIARKYMPASRANYANVYVNDVLQGLYTNLEDVSKDFLKENLGSRGGSFFKGNPPTVDLTGENCNLGNSLGTDSTAYYDVYDMQSDFGWTHLMQLIDVLNNDPANIESQLNVDRALWMHAFNYALINFDSYVGYAQNYYIYRDEWDRWNTIPWDLNMSFGSFRLTDASTYWNGFSVAQAPMIDPLSHFNSVSVYPRPLLRNLFLDPMQRRMYIAHLRTIMNENIADQSYRDRALELRAVIDPYVQADANKFYTYQSFLDNLDQSVSFTVAYPGLTELMGQRATYLSTYEGMTGQPVIGEPAHSPEAITVGSALVITASISDADTVFLAYRSGDDGLFDRMPMLDDGAHGDGAAGDGLYGASIIAGSNVIEFYIYAENDSAGTFSPERATWATHRIETRLAPGTLVINEFMASNNGQVVDEDGYASDWIELYNASGYTISTAGLHLSDDADDPTKWALPVKELDAGEFMIVWADERDAGDDHANFKLDTEGEALTLAYDSSAVLDAVVFGAQYPIYSTGRYPNGDGNFQRMAPTFDAYNRILTGYDVDRAFQIWPNPASDKVFGIVDSEWAFDLRVFRADGRLVAGPIPHGARQLIELDTYGLGSGNYIMQVRTNDHILSQPFIIIP